MTTSCFDPPSALVMLPTSPSPSVHCINRGSEEDECWVFRFWDEKTRQYVSEELSYSKFLQQHLQRSLQALLPAAITIPQARTLPCNWWNDKEEPVGEITEAETALKRNENPQAFDEKVECLTLIAHAAVTAYLKHLEDGGDPDDLPILSCLSPGQFMIDKTKPSSPKI